MTVQRQAQADRDACDRLLKAIFDHGLGQRPIARVAGNPLSTVQRALQRADEVRDGHERYSDNNEKDGVGDEVWEHHED